MPATLDATIGGAGQLQITDTAGVTNQLTLAIVAGNYVVADSAEQFIAAPAGWTLSGDGKSISAPTASFAGAIAISGAGGDDTLTVDLAGGDAIPGPGLTFDGGAQATTDSLVIAGGSQGTVAYTPVNPTDGSIDLSAFGTISHTGVESIANSGTADDVIFNLPAGPSVVTLGDDGTGGNGLSTLSSNPATFAPTTIGNPTNSLTVNRGNAADTVAVNALPDFTAGLTVGTAVSPFAAVNLNSGLSLTTGAAALDFQAAAINLQAVGPIGTTNGQTYGGAVVLRTHTTVAGGSISFNGTVDGLFRLTANSAGTTTFAGAVGATVGLAGLTTDPVGTTVLNGDVTIKPYQFGVEPFSNIFRIFGENYQAVSEVPATMAGFSVLGINGIALDPTTSQFYVIARVSGSSRRLGIIDPATAVITDVGSLGDNFSSITFSPTGVLYGATGDGASVPESLYTIDKATAARTLVYTMGNGFDGEVIVYNPLDNFIYHWSGNGTVVFEKLDAAAVTYAPVDIPTSGSNPNGEVFGATFDPVTGGFIICDIGSNVEHWTTTGVSTSLGVSLDIGGGSIDLRGLVPSLDAPTQVYGDTVRLANNVTATAATVRFGAGAGLVSAINGPTVGVDYFQFRAVGTLDLGGANLSVLPGFNPVTGATFTIVDNDGTTDAIVGTFAGLAEGAVFTGTQGTITSTFQISYQGGDGNDVVLTARNDGPVLAGAGSLTYTEGDPATAIAPAIAVSEPDSPTLADATVTVTNFVAGQDVLSFTNDGLTMGNISVVSNVGGVLSLTSAGATATVAEWQAALRAVTYANTSIAPTTTPRTVQFVATDGIDPGNTLIRTINITALNERPVIDTSFTPMLPALAIPQPKNAVIAGTPISTLVAHVTDVDGDPKGIAVTAFDGSNGQWQYSVDGGANWTSFPAVSDTAALPLADDGSTRVRFVPNKASPGVRAFNRGFADLTYRAWDRSDGATPVAPLVNVAGTAYSTEAERAWVAVGRTTPIVDVNGHPVLKAVPIPRNPRASAAFTVKKFLGLLARETDPTKVFGIAVSGATGTGAAGTGEWQFNTGKGGWQALGAVSDAQALLLRPTDRVRYFTGATFNGNAELTYHTWDLTTGGLFGTKVPATGLGFSTATEVSIINAAPVLVPAHPTLASVPAGATTPPSLVSALLGAAATDVEQTTLGIYVSAPRGGTWEYSLNGTDWVKVTRPVYLESTAQIRFTARPTARPGAVASLTFKAWDQTLKSPATLSKVFDKITVTIS